MHKAIDKYAKGTPVSSITEMTFMKKAMNLNV